AATTINGAAAMDLGHTHGAIAPGRRAALIVTTPIPALEFIPYHYTSPWIQQVIL
ncbi:MAG: amidohydrolase family protein, partial [Muribaculaceae bacterium]|nr:amidohydrolase family protein [Muribaculaceae bacterium]